MTNILEEASELINGDRALTYGPVTDNFNRIADLFNAYIGKDDFPLPLDAYDVANMMILVKLARTKTAGYHRDSYADIAGYAALAEKVNDEESGEQLIVEELWDEETQGEPNKNLVDWDEFWYGVDQSIKEAGTYRSLPRVWDSIKDIPEGVVAKDTGRAFWKVFESQSASSTNGTSWSSFDDFRISEDKFGPFTEVLS